MPHRPHPSDPSDDGRRLLEPLLPPRRRGRPPKRPRRLLPGAVFHPLRSGRARRVPPRGCPPWRAVQPRLRRRWRGGPPRRAHGRPRERARVAEGRTPEPAGGSSAAGPSGPPGAAARTARGPDGAERPNGRGRHPLVGTTGLAPLARVHAAGLQDREGGRTDAGRGRAGGSSPTPRGGLGRRRVRRRVRPPAARRAWPAGRGGPAPRPRPPRLAPRPGGEVRPRVPGPAP